MRFVSLAALMAAGFALSACGGSESTSSLTLSDGLEICGLNCPVDNAVNNGGSTVGNLPNTPTTTNTGNNTSLSDSSGDETIALEKSIMISDKKKLSHSKLTIDSAAQTAKIEIDTNSNRNSLWPKPKTMDYYEFGTIWNEAENQPGPNTPSNSRGLGGKYTEYRALTSSASDGTTVDEELQVWKWRYSYGTQYRDVTSGGPDADHQAWSFGGKRTAQAGMPTGGTATYTGQFGSTAKTFGWINTNDQRQTLSYNNLWQVKGTSNVKANFGNSSVAVTLTPTKWRAKQSMNGAKDFATVDLTNLPAGYNDPNSANYMPNAVGFMQSKIILKGTITKDAVKGNSVKGDSFLNGKDGWITNSSNNAFAGAFFGPNADEFTGIFNVEATYPGPYGGNFPITNDERGHVQHSGVVNATKQ